MIAIEGSTIITTILGIAALGISAGSLVLTARISKRKTNDDHTAALERRIESQGNEIDTLKDETKQLHKDLEECKAGRIELQQQNFGLMSRLYRLEHERGDK